MLIVSFQNLECRQTHDIFKLYAKQEYPNTEDKLLVRGIPLF